MPVCASLFLLHSLEESAQTHHIVPRNIFGRCKADDVLGPLDSVNSGVEEHHLLLALCRRGPNCSCSRSHPVTLGRRCIFAPCKSGPI